MGNKITKNIEKTKILKNETKQNNVDIEDCINLALEMQKNEIHCNIEFQISCVSLPKMDTFSLTDPFVIIELEDDDGNYQEIGRTEIIKDNLNPEFKQVFLIPKILDKRIKFTIKDIDLEDKFGNPIKSGLISYIEDKISVIFKNNKYSKSINNHLNSLFIINSKETDLSKSKISITFNFLDFLQENSMNFRVIGTSNLGDTYIIHESEYQKNSNKFVSFKEFDINLNLINNENSKLTIELFEKRKNNNIKSLAEINITLLNIFNKKNQYICMYKNGLKQGFWYVVNFNRNSNSKFLDYVHMGYCLKPIIAIDLTQSNFKERNGNNEEIIKNEIFEAIEKIGNLLNSFDDDNRICTLGFGSKIKPYFNTVSHCFSLNGNIFNPMIEGTEEIKRILNYELNNSKNFIPHGPIIYNEIIKYSSNLSRYMKDNNTKYYIVLVIISSGNIADLNLCIDEIILAEELPLSIIICAKDKQYKEIFEQLDSDKEYLTSKRLNKKAKRDIVQTFIYSDCNNDFKKLTNEIFQEIPEQFIDFMEKNKINLNKDQISNKTKKDLINELRLKRKNCIHNEQIIDEFFKQEKNNFLKEIKPLGYDSENINTILNQNGLPCKEINVLTELVGIQKSLKKNIKKELEITKEIINYKEPIKKISYLKKEKVLTWTEQILLPTPKKEKTKESENSVIQEEEQNKNLKILNSKIYNNIIQENNMEYDNKCIKCKKNNINIVFLNCGHSIFCNGCVSKFKENCQVCGQKIINYVEAEKKQEISDYSDFSDSDDYI